MNSEKTRLKPIIFGGVLSALLASSCCILPVVFAVLGVGSVGAALYLEKLRAVFILIALALLGYAMFKVYNKTDNRCVHNDSGAKDCACGADTSRPVSLLIVWFALIFSVILITFPYWFGFFVD